MRLKLGFLAILTCSAFWSMPLMAQTVAIHSGEEQGHGFLVRDGATCYVILPKHVAAGRRSVTVFSAAPVVHSSALIETPFWDGMDLAIGVVRGEVESRCIRNVSDLDVSVQPEAGSKVQLLRLRQSGEPERIDMLMTDSQYLTLDADIADGKSELFKGTSGAFLFDGDTPLGMVIEAVSPTKGRFIRIEEIFQNVNRRVERRAGFASAEDPVDANPAATDEGLPFVFVSATLPPIDPALSEANLSGAGSYVFKLTKPNRLAFKVAGNEAMPVSGITVVSSVDDISGLPRDIKIEVSSSEDGQRTRPFASAEMATDGVLDIRRSPTLARWVFISIQSGWDGAEIGIDSVIIK